jgi:Inorganic pyrophosphatase
VVRRADDEKDISVLTEIRCMSNLWTDLPTGPNPPEEIYAVVECLKGERNKYEYDKDVPGVVLDRVLHSNVHYPSDYGFIPQSYYDDEDPFDVLVLVEDQTFPGCVIEARPVALMRMDDDGEKDDKVIAVPSEDPRYDHIQDLEDIPQQELDEIDEFFATYKNLEAGKEVATGGFEGREAAFEAIEHAQELYDEQFG